MSDQFVAEIRIVPFNFAPNGWAFCDGQLIPISQNTALFSLLGTQYGGDGKSTFALPDLQGNVPMHSDQYRGIGMFPIGTSGGEQSVTLLNAEIPAHAHSVAVTTSAGNQTGPAGHTLAAVGRGRPQAYAVSGAGNVTMNPQVIGTTGGGQPHNNMQPYLALNFVIALQGIFPARS